MRFRPGQGGWRWPLIALALAVVGSGAAFAADAASASGPTLFLITPKALAFGNIPIGSSAPTQTITITNVSKQPQTMSGAGGGAGIFGGAQNCQGQTLSPGSSCHMFYAFSPTATGLVKGSTRGSWNGQSFALNFTGTGTPQFLITPTSLTFGHVQLGSTSAQQTINITNLSNQSVVMSGAGGGAGVFGGAQNCQGQTLAAGGSCQMFYAFSPSATGVVNGSTNGSWNGQAFSLTFSGTGTPQFLITPTSVAFGRVKVGTTSAQQMINITNLSNHSVVMSGAGGGAGVFGGAQNCQGQTLAAGASCQMLYAFTPTATGVVNGSTNGSWNGQSFSLVFTGSGT